MKVLVGQQYWHSNY